MEEGDRWLTTEQAAKVMSVSLRSLEYGRRGIGSLAGLRFTRLGNRKVLYSMKAIQAFMAEREGAGDAT